MVLYLCEAIVIRKHSTNVTYYFQRASADHGNGKAQPCFVEEALADVRKG